MSRQMKLIMESWREKFLKEEFTGEEKWNKGKDSDFNTKILFFVDDKYINEPYPKPDGQNHGMASHAIKHAHEFFDIDSDLEKFKKVLTNLAKTKELYVRAKLPNKKIETIKVNNDILQTIAKAVEISKMPKGPEKKEANKEIRNDLITKTGLENQDPVRLLQFYKDTLIPRIENPSKADFMSTLDFYHDKKELKSLEFFDGNLIEKYKNFVNNVIKKYGKDFKTVPDRNPNSDKKELEIGDTLVILQKPKTEKDYKISTAFKPNKK